MNRAQVAEYLEKEGLRFSGRGTRFVTEILELLDDPEAEYSMMELYTKVAEAHNTTAKYVERNIRYELIKTGKNAKSKEFIAKAAYKLGARGWVI